MLTSKIFWRAFAAKDIFDIISSGDAETHDLIVYGIKAEFDQNNDGAVFAAIEEFCKNAGILPKSDKADSKYLIPAITMNEYEEYIAAGNKSNATIANNIKMREERERLSTTTCYVPMSQEFINALKKLNVRMLCLSDKEKFKAYNLKNDAMDFFSEPIGWVIFIIAIFGALNGLLR